MKLLFPTLALLVRAHALVRRAGGPCCFHLSASGAVTGTVGQLDDGQARVNGPLPPATFCISSGNIFDSMNRGCILTREFP